MTERDLVIECIPQITEMAIAVKGMSAGEYKQFKQEHLEDVKKPVRKHLDLSVIFTNLLNGVLRFDICRGMEDARHVNYKIGSVVGNATIVRFPSGG